MRIHLLAVLLAACATDPVTGDDRDDAFGSDGKADGIVEEGSPQALAILRVVNESALAKLDGDVGLSARTARNIISYRAGTNGRLGTSDDRTIATMAELDGIPYVGPVSLRQLVTYVSADTSPACSVLDEKFEDCLPEHGEGCFDIYTDEVDACCIEGNSPSQLCKDIREHLDL